MSWLPYGVINDNNDNNNNNNNNNTVCKTCGARVPIAGGGTDEPCVGKKGALLESLHPAPLQTIVTPLVSVQLLYFRFRYFRCCTQNFMVNNKPTDQNLAGCYERLCTSPVPLWLPFGRNSCVSQRAPGRL